jgi:hypothetical protein
MPSFLRQTPNEFPPDFELSIEPWDERKHPDNLPSFDNVKLTAIATCPTFGIMRYQHHKVYASPRRSMPLVAGLAAHEAFSAVRLGDLFFNGHMFYPDMDCKRTAIRRANQLFGSERTIAWVEKMSAGEDIERSVMLGALEIFNSTGFYDDPDDKRRTIANIEETIIAYCSRYPMGKTMCVVDIDKLGRQFVGVEIPIKMFLRIRNHDVVREYKFLGRVDGVMWTGPDKTAINVEDDKTASRLNDAWHESWKIAHQMTGYCAAINALLGVETMQGIVRGASIPLPKTYDYGGVVNVPFRRNLPQFKEWADYVVHIMDIMQKYVNTPLSAPRYTHSCNRYFRPCSYIPFCDSDMEERALMYSEMDDEVWDPTTGAHYDEEEHDV